VAARLTAYIVSIIVAITLIAGLIAGAQREDDGPVDVMVVNGKVYTADGKGTTAEAVAIQGNKILRVGTTREIQRLRRAQTVVIDAKGGAVLPGFIESNADLTDAPSEVQDPALMGPASTPTRDEELAALRAATVDAHIRGVTSIQTAGGTPRELEIFDELRREGALALRVYATLSAGPDVSSEQLEEFEGLRQKYEDDPLFKAGAVEIVVSSVDPRARFTSAALNRLVSELDRRGWQIVIVAADDGALAMALTAFEDAAATNPAPIRGRRHRIEHGEIVGPIEFAGFDRLGIVHGRPRHASTLPQAIDSATRQAAWASFDEQRKGSLVRDMLADVVILSKDIFALPDVALDEAEVSVTIFDGKVVFQKPTE
jgi:predicted amidohydrolase YtcJ